jgi:MFS family permease
MDSNYKGMRGGFATVTTLFFMWGFITVSIDPLIAALKAIFELSYTQSSLTQFAFFMAYFVVSLPAAALIARLGNSKSIMFALGVMVLGCFIVPAATHFDTYWLVAGAVHLRLPQAPRRHQAGGRGAEAVDRHRVQVALGAVRRRGHLSLRRRRGVHRQLPHQFPA